MSVAVARLLVAGEVNDRGDAELCAVPDVTTVSADKPEALVEPEPVIEEHRVGTVDRDGCGKADSDTGPLDERDASTLNDALAELCELAQNDALS